MASITQAHLSINVTSGKVTPKVTYKLSFNQGDMNLLKLYPNLFSVRCELWGSDSGFNGGDDKLFIFPVTHRYPDTSISATESNHFEFPLNKGAELDEDWESGDEIYAKVFLINNLCNMRTAKNSNTVSGSF